MRKLLVLLAAALAVTAPLIAPAAADPKGYPPGHGGTTTTRPPDASGSQDLGKFPVGAEFVAESCGYQPNSPVDVYANGTLVKTDSADANGCAQQTVVILSCTSMTVDGLEASAKVSNKILTSGTASAGGAYSFLTTFKISGCGGKGGALSVTGVDAGGWMALALGLVGAGSVLVVAERRRGQSRG